MRRLAIDRQRLDALGDVGLADHHAALGGDPHPAALLDALFLGQRLADFDELLRLEDGIDQRVLGPEVEMLGQAIGGGHIGEVFRGAEDGAVVREDARRRVGSGLPDAADVLRSGNSNGS